MTRIGKLIALAGILGTLLVDLVDVLPEGKARVVAASFGGFLVALPLRLSGLSGPDPDAALPVK